MTNEKKNKKADAEPHQDYADASAQRSAAQQTHDCGASLDTKTPPDKQDSGNEKIEKIAELEGRIAELEDKHIRSLAALDNYRKRSYKDIQEAKFASRIDSILPFLQVMDHFKLALKAASEKHSLDVLRKGMDMIFAEFMKAIEESGVEIIEAESGNFDPLLHQAAEYRHSDKVPEGKIIEQWRCGYRFGDRIIRPALVVVSSGPENEKNNDRNPGNDGNVDKAAGGAAS